MVRSPSRRLATVESSLATSRRHLLEMRCRWRCSRLRAGPVLSRPAALPATLPAMRAVHQTDSQTSPKYSTPAVPVAGLLYPAPHQPAFGKPSNSRPGRRSSLAPPLVAHRQLAGSELE